MCMMPIFFWNALIKLWILKKMKSKWRWHSSRSKKTEKVELLYKFLLNSRWLLIIIIKCIFKYKASPFKVFYLKILLTLIINDSGCDSKLYLARGPKTSGADQCFGFENDLSRTSKLLQHILIIWWNENRRKNGNHNYFIKFVC